MQFTRVVNTVIGLLWVLGGVLTGLALLGASHHGHADTNNDLQYWAPVVLEVPAGRAKATMEVQPRVGSNFGKLSTILVRPSLTWDVSKKVALTAGYAWVPTYIIQPGQRVFHEDRLWQQVAVSTPLNRREKPIRLTNQFRLEERFIPDADLAWRARYLIHLAVPVKQSRWSWIVSNELLINLNAVRGVPGGLGQNRFFTGMRRQMSKAVVAEAGYMMQWFNFPTGQPNQLNHALLTRLTVTLPPFKLARPHAKLARMPGHTAHADALATFAHEASTEAFIALATPDDANIIEPEGS